MQDETVGVQYHNGGVGPSSGFDHSTFGTYFLNPEMVLDPAGKVILAYYTGQSDGDPAATYRATRSDGSALGAAIDAIVRQPLRLGISLPPGKSWVGDYTGLAMVKDVLLTSYVDNSSGESHIALHRMTVP
jgi:hypothetical protein